MSEFIKYPEIGATYIHYKGGKYRVITLAKHSETSETLVIYESIHFGSVYARPLGQWFEEVEETRELNLHSPKKIERFQLVSL